MRRLLSWCGCLTLLVFSGCAMCANPHDCKYAAYGGRRARADMVHGRVGSVFDPAPEVSQQALMEQSPARDTRPLPDGDLREPRRAPQPAAPSDLESLTPRPEPIEPAPDQTVPELPEGTIELPEFGPDDRLPDQLPSPGTLPPDLPGNNDRSARRHPLQGLFEDEVEPNG
jgi:hypothetical protein